MRFLIGAALAALLAGGCTTGTRTAPPTLDSGREIDTLQPFEMTAKALAGRYGAGRVLLVYDIDNTLLASRTALGSDQWFDWQAGGADGGARVSTDFGCLLAAQGVLFHLGEMRLTHPGVALAVRRLQDDGHPSLVLTSRGPEFALATHRELRRNALDFGRRPPLGAFGQGDGPGPETWLPYTPGAVRGFGADEIARFRLDASGDRPRPVRYDDGVFFTSGQHKGAMLRILLDRLGLTGAFDAIVFADDKRRHVDAMTDALTAIGKQVAAYHYVAERGAVDAFEADRDGVRTATAAQWCRVAGALPALEAVFGPRSYAGGDDAACAPGWAARCAVTPAPVR